MRYCIVSFSRVRSNGGEKMSKLLLLSIRSGAPDKNFIDFTYFLWKLGKIESSPPMENPGSNPWLNHVLLFVCLYLKKSLDNVNDHKTTLQTWMDLDLLQPLIVRCVYPVALCAAVGLQSPPEALEWVPVADAADFPSYLTYGPAIRKYRQMIL